MDDVKCYLPAPNSTASPGPALFLDRDGVLIVEVEYLARPDQVQLIPGAAAAVRFANDAGWKVIVVTNQSGVARGLFPESILPEVHRRIAELLNAEAGAKIDGFYYCPHHPTAGLGEYKIDCDCRKPKPGMLLRAAREFHIDLQSSWMIGDRPSDWDAGGAAGCRSIRVRTGYGNSWVAPVSSRCVIFPSIAEAIPFALSQSARNVS